MERYHYLLVMVGCLAVTLPLEFVYGARVWRRPRRLLSVVAVPFVLFALWDAVSIARGHWRFHPDRVTGWEVPFDLPVEELLFFFAVPTASILAYEAVRRSLSR